jgi:ESCRT-II complex subunit VPS22
MRRGIGAAGIVANRERNNRMMDLGAQIENARNSKFLEIFEKFKIKLTNFLNSHKNRIFSDPEFRELFLSLCGSVGIDPFTIKDSKIDKIFGKFYVNLSIQILTNIYINRNKFGNLVPIEIIIESVQSDMRVSLHDIKRSVESLNVFGDGMPKIIDINGKMFLSSLPDELSADTPTILDLIGGTCGIGMGELKQRTGWEPERTSEAVNSLIREGVLWFDHIDQTYWPIAFFLARESTSR